LAENKGRLTVQCDEMWSFVGNKKNKQWKELALDVNTAEIVGRAVGKNSGRTNLIEWFNCTLRQRVSRLVRDTLSFSKKLDNPIGAIWYFVHHYNTSLLF